MPATRDEFLHFSATGSRRLRTPLQMHNRGNDMSIVCGRPDSNGGSTHD